ncbi:MAG TPA: barstar family protein [Candidatus Jeotgalibaca merdavium]|uniref:Barnase inhibitor n=2 Tax=Jeotgalibaca TaxID=1470540 RepID=A0A6G7KAI8_9LACT|nr:barstar family protein [Jeotgalibaca arthritidis]QII82270.1 barnase inhibitor [Jeotgalibaca arthritidis]HJA89491.1 barstar family protein [Candidatus Jeotgalibaca merdavium]
MEQIILDGREFLDKETSHDYLSRQLGLADHYGRNLDALWDCLTTDFTPKRIVIRHPQAISQQLGRYGVMLLSLFSQLKRANPSIVVVMAYQF